MTRISLPGALAKKLSLLLLVFVLPLNVLSLGAAYIMISDAQDSARSAQESLLSSYSVKVDEHVTNTSHLLYELIDGNDFMRGMLTLPEGDSYQIARHRFFVTTSQTLITSRAADMIFLEVDSADDLVIVPDSAPAVGIKEFRAYLLSDDAPNISRGWQLVQISGSPCLIISLNGRGYRYGALISLDRMTADIEQFLDYSDYQLIFAMNESVAVPDGMTDIAVSSDECGLILHLLIPRSEFIRGISFWKWGVLALFLLYITLIPLLYFFLKKWVILPLRILNTAHAELKAGHQDYRIQTAASSHEFHTAYESFNAMAERIQTLTLETINQELAYKQMLLTNLQLQIRPHFLLNTFNLVHTLIQTHRNEAAQKLILYLSEYFRYLFQYAEDLELFQKEYRLVCDYLDMAALQFPDAFTFSSQIDPEIDLIRIPPLLLHNFIENIISHALVAGRVVHIMFCAFYDDGTVTFQIADDGRGMSEEDVAQINQGEYTSIKKGKHLGIRNSITRLKYFYQGQASVTVESSVNEGTTFTITFPYDLELQEEYS